MTTFRNIYQMQTDPIAKTWLQLPGGLIRPGGNATPKGALKQPHNEWL